MPHVPQKRNLQAPDTLPQPLSGSVWQLPGGQTLAEFALRGGIVAPKLLRTSPRLVASPRQAEIVPGLRRSR